MAGRFVILVADSVGAGAMPDAAAYGDAGSDTLGNLSRAVGGLRLPVMGRMGLGRLTAIEGNPPDLFSPPAGCPYFERCPFAMQVCGPHDPPAWPVEPGHESRCWLHHAHARERRPAQLFRGAEMEATP